jgi:hypothetical protein
LLLIWSANDRAAMGSNTACPVGAMSATDRTVVPITVMARIWLAHSHSPVGADAPSPIDPIDTSGCVAWLGEHERAKRNHNGERQCTTSIEAKYSVFHFRCLVD